MKNNQDICLGDAFRLRRGDEERIVVVSDFPGDRSMVALEPSLLDDPKLVICGFEEVEEGDDPRPPEVGWHVSTSKEDEPWEIVEIIRKKQADVEVPPLANAEVPPPAGTSYLLRHAVEKGWVVERRVGKVLAFLKDGAWGNVPEYFALGEDAYAALGLWILKK